MGAHEEGDGMYEGDIEMAAKQASTYDFSAFPEDLVVKTSDSGGEVGMSMDETNRCETMSNAPRDDLCSIS